MNIIKELHLLCCDVFDEEEDDIEVTDETTANDIEGWDSLFPSKSNSRNRKKIQN